VDFYKHIGQRDLQYIAQFMGYPPLSIQSAYTRRFLETSCQNIKSHMNEIAELYDSIKSLYDAYKHGYRISFATDQTGADVFTYIDIENKQHYVPVSKDDFKKIQRRAASCHELFKLIFALHKERIRYEISGGVQNAPIKIKLYRPPNDPKPNEENLVMTYPSRGEMLEELRKEGNVVYSIFKDDLGKNHYGKIVAIDMDEKKKVALDYDLENVIQTIHQNCSTGRIIIRRIGRDERIGVEVY
jgi:hypothetical protein